jgi:hypothetical protein
MPPVDEVAVPGSPRRLRRVGTAAGVTEPSEDDRAAVADRLGRPPQGAFWVVVRDADDDAPVVVCNAPLLDDGTPMPTRYWLVDPELNRRVGRLESAGGVRAAEAAVDEAALADAHRRAASERAAALPDGHTGPAPSGGVGGTRRGVKCLHAHYAWWLAGGDDPVGAWVHAHLGDLQLGGEEASADA